MSEQQKLEFLQLWLMLTKSSTVAHSGPSATGLHDTCIL